LAWFALGELREKLGDRAEAIAAYRRAREADPDDRHGAMLRLVRLGAEELAAMPPAYVRTLFDQYAPTFDKALVDDLDYRGPQVLLRAVLGIFHGSGRRPSSGGRPISDAGRGSPPAHSPPMSANHRRRPVPGMIDQARATGLYARLDVADMVAGPARRA